MSHTRVAVSTSARLVVFAVVMVSMLSTISMASSSVLFFSLMFLIVVLCVEGEVCVGVVLVDNMLDGLDDLLPGVLFSDELPYDTGLCVVGVFEDGEEVRSLFAFWCAFAVVWFWRVVMVRDGVLRKCDGFVKVTYPVFVFPSEYVLDYLRPIACVVSADVDALELVGCVMVFVVFRHGGCFLVTVG